MEQATAMTETETIELKRSLISLADVSSSADFLPIIKTEGKV